MGRLGRRRRGDAPSFRGNSVTSRLGLGMFAAIISLALDQASKLWLLYVFDIGRRGLTRVTPFLDLVLAWNTGISYGWFSDSGPTGQVLLIAFKVIAVIVLAVWMVKAHNRLATFALGLIIGGALGNAIDRLAYGAVVDFALLHVDIAGKTYNWYVFNLADAAIVAGVAALLYDSFLGTPAVKAP
jgi:signal peptidase II